MLHSRNLWPNFFGQQSTHLLGEEGLDEDVVGRVVRHLVQPHDDPLRLQPLEDREERVDPLLWHEGRLEDEAHREEDDAVLGLVEEVLQVLNMNWQCNTLETGYRTYRIMRIMR